MLHPEELAAVAEEFGVSDEQVRRDHLLSHLLSVLSERAADDVVFFGGTALARTHLPHGRLSEDLDLVALPRRTDVVRHVESLLAHGVRRDFGRLTWDPPLSAVRDVDPAVLRTNEGLTVRVQLLDPIGYPPWPTEVRPLIQRYRDAPPASLVVPTLAAFVASKTAAWHDRRAPRDLYDLCALASRAAVDGTAADLFARLGPTGRTPKAWMFDSAPSAADWATQLGGQTRVTVAPDQALAVVRDAWASVEGG